MAPRLKRSRSYKRGSSSDKQKSERVSTREYDALNLYLRSIERFPEMEPKEHKKLSKIMNAVKPEMKSIVLDMHAVYSRIANDKDHLYDLLVKKNFDADKVLEVGDELENSLLNYEEFPDLHKYAMERSGQFENAKARYTETANEFVKGNLRLVIPFVRPRLGRGLPFLDLIQCGNIGLRRGAIKYDWRIGTQFSTYVTWWIKQGMDRAIAETSREIRLPVHTFDYIYKLNKAKNEFARKYGVEPTPEELAEETGFSLGKVNRLEQAEATMLTASLDYKNAEKDGGEYYDIIQDRKADNPAEVAASHNAGEKLREVLRFLSPKEIEVLNLRFGLDDGTSCTLEEVGKRYDVTRERIRQIEAKSLRKLRHPRILRELKACKSF